MRTQITISVTTCESCQRNKRRHKKFGHLPPKEAEAEPVKEEPKVEEKPVAEEAPVEEKKSEIEILKEKVDVLIKENEYVSRKKNYSRYNSNSTLRLSFFALSE